MGLLKNLFFPLLHFPPSVLISGILFLLLFYLCSPFFSAAPFSLLLWAILFLAYKIFAWNLCSLLCSLFLLLILFFFAYVLLYAWRMVTMNPKSFLFFILNFALILSFPRSMTFFLCFLRLVK